jgi:hypothetical protein
MKIQVDDVFFLSDAGLASFAVTVVPPAELKEGWYSLTIRGEQVTSFWTKGEDFHSPYNPKFKSISTKELEKIRAHVFEKGSWELEPILEPN